MKKIKKCQSCKSEVRIKEGVDGKDFIVCEECGLVTSLAGSEKGEQTRKLRNKRRGD